MDGWKEIGGTFEEEEEEEEDACFWGRKNIFLFFRVVGEILSCCEVLGCGFVCCNSLALFGD